MNRGDANQKLVDLIDTTTEKVFHLEDALRERAVSMIQLDIIRHCIAYGFDPCSYLDYCDKKLTEYAMYTERYNNGI